jgi:CheY-like chemotaxis protein
MDPAKQFCILLADDDDDDTFLFREALEQIQVKAKLVVAENGMKLMDILQGNDAKPDLIFLDMNMPVKNGLECLQEIRESEELLHIPVVILSTSVADYPIELAYTAGANLYIQKPTSFSALVDTLKKCILDKSGIGRSANREHFLIRNTNH